MMKSIDEKFDINVPTVVIRQCDRYEVDQIEQYVSEGLSLMQLTPHGRTLIKPNVVASGEHFPHAYTRPEFTEGVARALKKKSGSRSKYCN